MKKVIVCGSRDYFDRMRVNYVLDRVMYAEGPLFIIHGGARGADQLAGEWAADRGIPCAIVPANWKTYGKGAGPIRNSWMLELKPDLVVAFPGGTGTANMISQAKEKGVRVMEVGE